jgi:hypothetical protein
VTLDRNGGCSFGRRTAPDGGARGGGGCTCIRGTAGRAADRRARPGIENGGEIDEAVGQISGKRSWCSSIRFFVRAGRVGPHGCRRSSRHSVAAAWVEGHAPLSGGVASCRSHHALMGHSRTHPPTTAAFEFIADRLDPGDNIAGRGRNRGSVMEGGTRQTHQLASPADGGATGSQ